MKGGKSDQAKLRSQAKRVGHGLAKLYPDAHTALEHHNPFQLLIATILSAQCTDKMVNKVTPSLFARFPNAAAMANADVAELENLIKPTGFYRNKTKSLMACSKTLVEKHQGKVPPSLEELTKLPGVGRKTANVVLGDCFGIPGVVVDTHVQRLSKRLGLTQESTPERIEQDLMALFPKEEWTLLSHRLIYHGRQVCDARRPRCAECTLQSFCPRIGVADHSLVDSKKNKSLSGANEAQGKKKRL
jgi:endonuclease-3